MIEACTILVRQLHTSKSIDGIIALGGTGGTSLAANVMRSALPIGFPKLIVSTVASGDTSSYIGESDITLMPSIVDIAGLNSVLRMILENAAAAIVAMTKLSFERSSNSGPGGGVGCHSDKQGGKRIAITMFGVTTPAVTTAMKYLSSFGHEVFTFHATGTGGRAMERLISEGSIDGVLDLTTTELADELIGGVMSAGSSRLTGARRAGLPQIVSVGALDMVNFGSRASVPEKFQNRKLLEHNPSITLMRTTKEECSKLGQVISERLKDSCRNTKEVEVWIPTQGVSMIAGDGGPFYDKEADEALFEALRKGLTGSEIKLEEKDMMINDPDFATGMARRLLQLMGV